MNETVELAKKIATEAHKEQTYYDGKPYISHSEAVAELVPEELKALAWLHDVLGNTDVTADELLKEGIPLFVLEGLEAITRSVGEPYAEYIERCGENEPATRVKIADLTHNLNTMNDSNLRRRGFRDKYEKYELALMWLKRNIDITEFCGRKGNG